MTQTDVSTHADRYLRCRNTRVTHACMHILVYRHQSEIRLETCTQYFAGCLRVHVSVVRV